MKTIELQVYDFEELSDKSKQRAIDSYRSSCTEYFWTDEGMDSIRAFVDHFGAELTDWRIGPYSPIDFDVHVTNNNFRGMKLRDFNREHMPTGYCVDCDLWMTFYDEFKKTGDAKTAFMDALHAGFYAIRADMELQDSEEFIIEHILMNEYQFDETGKRI